MSQNLVNRSTVGNSNILEENIKVLVVSSVSRKTWMILSVYQAGHARNVEQKCKWTHTAGTENSHVFSSPMSPHTSQLFFLKCIEWNKRQVLGGMNCNSNWLILNLEKIHLIHFVLLFQRLTRDTEQPCENIHPRSSFKTFSLSFWKKPKNWFNFPLLIFYFKSWLLLLKKLFSCWRTLPDPFRIRWWLYNQLNHLTCWINTSTLSF